MLHFCVEPFHQISQIRVYLPTGRLQSLQLNNLVNGCYKDALLKTVTIPTSSNDKGETLKSHFAEEKVERKNHFLKMMLKFLAK